MYEKYGNCYFTIIPVKQITDHRGCLKKCVFSRSPSLGAVHGLTEDFDGIRKQLEAVAPQHTHVALPFRIENARSFSSNQNGNSKPGKWQFAKSIIFCLTSLRHFRILKVFFWIIEEKESCFRAFFVKEMLWLIWIISAMTKSFRSSAKIIDDSDVVLAKLLYFQVTDDKYFF